MLAKLMMQSLSEPHMFHLVPRRALAKVRRAEVEVKLTKPSTREEEEDQ